MGKLVAWTLAEFGTPFGAETGAFVPLVLGVWTCRAPKTSISYENGCEHKIITEVGVLMILGLVVDVVF